MICTSVQVQCAYTEDCLCSVLRARVNMASPYSSERFALMSTYCEVQYALVVSDRKHSS